MSERKYLKPEERNFIFERDMGRCVYCGSDRHGKSFHIDHRRPQSRGGSWDIGNYETTCPSCNQSKGKQTPEEWLKREMTRIDPYLTEKNVRRRFLLARTKKTYY